MALAQVNISMRWRTTRCRLRTQSHRHTPAPVRAPSLPWELVMEVQVQVLVLFGNSVSWEHWVHSEPRFLHLDDNTYFPGSWTKTAQHSEHSTANGVPSRGFLLPLSP